MATSTTMPNRFELSDRSTVVGLFVGSLLYFALNIDFLIRGDATTYASYVLLGKFDDITLHNGYYFLLYALHHWVAAPLGYPVHETLAIANVVFGAIAVALMLPLSRALGLDRNTGVLGALIFMLSGRVLMNATSSEIYMLQTVCVMSSMLLYVNDRALLAGLAAGAALLVSPLSAFAFLFFPAWELTEHRRIRWPHFGLFVLGGTLVYLPYLLTCWRELFWGRRGLLVVREAAKPDLQLLAVNTVKYQVKHYTLLWLLLPPALLRFSVNRRFFLLAMSVAVPHLYIVAKLTTEDHTFLLNVDPFIALLLALGGSVLLARTVARPLVAAVAVGHLALYAKAGVIFSGEHNRGYASEVRAIVKQYVEGKPAILITDWDVAIAATHFGRDTVTDVSEREPLFRQMYDLTDDEGRQPSIEGQELLLLDPWSPSPLNRLLRNAEALVELENEMSIRAKAERSLKLRCTKVSEQTHKLYRCQRVGSGAVS
jgi:hypothetical protein